MESDAKYSSYSSLSFGVLSAIDINMFRLPSIIYVFEMQYGCLDMFGCISWYLRVCSCGGANDELQMNLNGIA